MKPTKTKNPVGRPPFYSNPEVMKKKIDEYFDHCDKGELIEVYSKKKQEVITMVQKIPYTVPGLSNYLGFESRQSFLDYEKNRKTKELSEDERELQEAFACTIRRARLKIEQQRNEKALTGEQEPRFAQFDLKENFRWKDVQEIDNRTKITVTVTDKYLPRPETELIEDDIA